MLLCAVPDIPTGAVCGASILHPGRPELELIARDTELTAAMIGRLQKLGVGEVWIRYDGTEDLDGAVTTGLTLAQREVFTALKEDFSRSAQRTISAASMASYRTAVSNMICEIISGKAYAGLASRLRSEDAPLFSHSASVAYLSMLAGLELENYVIQSRGRLDSAHAKDMTPLGIAGMLHDIGKTPAGDRVRNMHELQGADLGETPYRAHPIVSAKLLADDRIPATARNAVLMHHQRWDGTGWPTNKELGWDESKPLKETNLHVFGRILSAANALDNLLTSASGDRRPPVAALYLFASERLDGWFDPVVRRTLLRQAPPFVVGSMVTLSDGRKCVVIAPNRERPCRPTVRPIGENGSEQPSADAVALDQHPELFIARAQGVDVSRYMYELPKAGVDPTKAKSDDADRATAEAAGVKPAKGGDKAAA